MRFVFLIAVVFVLKTTSAQQYPPNIFRDTAFAPFVLGVASGDPMQDRVIIWTKVDPGSDQSQTSETVQWQVALTPAFDTLVEAGELTTTAQSDFTVKVDVKNLQPGHQYYYRFKTQDNKFSQLGIAKTLPDDSVKQFKLAMVSCSSIWAGFFNTYRRISERSDIDFVIHLGDYVYDYPDKKQLNRMPSEYPKDCASLSDWRERHTYYLLDPDLRAARQNKTWIAEWDNHDTDVEAPGETWEAIQAFYEYLPIRMPDSLRPEKIYRQFRFGNLADLNMIDMQLFRGKEEYEPGKKSVLGNEQDEWLKNKLKNSTTLWHLIGNQEMMTDWLSEGAPKAITSKRGNGRVFDPGNWNGFPEDRQRLYDFISNNSINNVVVLTGDIHMSFVMNMTGTPKDKTLYNKLTGEGAVGVEITGPSVSRVNMKEAGVPGFLIPLIQTVSRSINPHHVWNHFTEHGYFTLNVTPEKCEAEYWYVPINKITDKEKFGRGYIVLNGKNHWEKRFYKRSVY